MFAFTLKNAQDQTDSWHIDLKEKGDVAKGEAPEGKKADGESIFLSLAYLTNLQTSFWTA